MPSVQYYRQAYNSYSNPRKSIDLFTGKLSKYVRKRLLSAKMFGDIYTLPYYCACDETELGNYFITIRLHMYECFSVFLKVYENTDTRIRVLNCFLIGFRKKKIVSRNTKIPNIVIRLRFRCRYEYRIFSKNTKIPFFLDPLPSHMILR